MSLFGPMTASVNPAFYSGMVDPSSTTTAESTLSRTSSFISDFGDSDALSESPIQPSSAAAKLVRDEAFYFRCVVFSAQETLFKVPVYALPTEEGIFSAMFELSDGNGEGEDDRNPVRLPSEVTPEEFRNFLKACIPMPNVSAPQLTFYQWMDVHKLATMWCLNNLRAKVIVSADRELPSFSYSGDRNMQKVLLGKQYCVSRWLLDGYEAFGKRVEYLSAGERAQLGSETSFQISELREKSWAWALANEKPEPASYYGPKGREHPCEERNNFDYRTAIHSIFEEELRLGPNYDGPPSPVQQFADPAPLKSAKKAVKRSLLRYG